MSVPIHPPTNQHVEPIEGKLLVIGMHIVSNTLKE